MGRSIRQTGTPFEIGRVLGVFAHATAALLGVAPLVAPALAVGQSAAGQAAAGQTAAPKKPEDDFQAAVEQNRKNGEQLKKFEIPMATEPAFLFKA